MISEETKQEIRDAFQSGQLRVTAVNPSTEEVVIRPLFDVLEHDTSHKNLVKVTLVDGQSVITTVDHSLFLRGEYGLLPVESSELHVGDKIATVNEDKVEWVEVSEIENLSPEDKTYDLSVPGPENFLLTNGILAHNSYSISGVSLDLEKSSKYAFVL